MSDPIVSAAVPSLVATLQALKTFIMNLGANPAEVPIKFPGALTVLLGTVEMQFPGLVTAEFAALQGQANSKIDGWISQLQTKA